MARLTISTPIRSSSSSSLTRIDRRRAAEQRHATARNDAFFDRRAGRVQRVFDAGFLFLHLGLGRGADIDDGHATGELGQAFLQFFAIVIAKWFLRSGGGSDSRGPGSQRILPSPSTMVVFSLSTTIDLGAAEVFEVDALELDAEIFGDELAAGEDGDVFASWLCGDRRSQGL